MIGQLVTDIFSPVIFWHKFHAGKSALPGFYPAISGKRPLAKFVNLMTKLGKIINTKLGLAGLIEISVNQSIYNRKRIVHMKIKQSVTFNGCSIHLFN